MNPGKNLYAPPVLRGEGCPTQEEITTLWQGKEVRVERILSTGQSSPPGFWYDQQEDEWLALLTGYAVLEYGDGQRHTLHPGDTLLIPKHCRHRVAETSKEPPALWLCVFAEGEVGR